MTTEIRLAVITTKNGQIIEVKEPECYPLIEEEDGV